MPKIDYISIAKCIGENKKPVLEKNESLFFDTVMQESVLFTEGYDVQKGLAQLNLKLDKPFKNIFFKSKFWYAAASILLLIGLSIGVFNQHNKSILLTSQHGANKAFTLPDKSKVILFGGSEISYNKAFNGQIRAVGLSGKAYFRVVENLNKPFIIATNKGNITVLGTSFSVQSFEKSSLFGVEVFSGKVKVAIKDTTINLTKGMHLSLDQNGNIAVKENKMAVFNSSHFYYENAKVSQIIGEIEAQFGISIDYNKKLGDEIITINTNADNADSLLKIIAATMGSPFRIVSEN